MIKLDVKQRDHYHGFLEWMIQNVGQPEIDWEYVTQDMVGTYNLGLVVGVKVFDPQKELLTIMRWS